RCLVGTNGTQRVLLYDAFGPEVTPAIWLGRTRIPENADRSPEGPDASLKSQADLPTMHEPSTLFTNKADPSLAARYERLMSVSVAIGSHRDTEGLFSVSVFELL